jgi:hypothetical protein
MIVSFKLANYSIKGRRLSRNKETDDYHDEMLYVDEIFKNYEYDEEITIALSIGSNPFTDECPALWVRIGIGAAVNTCQG